MVKEIVTNKTNRVYYSNIKTFKTKNNNLIDGNMLIKKKTYIPDGCRKEKTDLSLNLDFWKKAVKKHKSISIVLDEAHELLNSRRSMSAKNQLMNSWLSLIRRVVGQSEDGGGELVLITQLPNRIDSFARSLATSVQYHLMHYEKTCKDCGCTWKEHNEFPETLWSCPKCKSHEIYKHSFVIEVYHFANMKKYTQWEEWGEKSHHRHYFITDVENYFSNYDTLQWENLLEDI